jgi:AcrR family transcriptional regulator
VSATIGIIVDRHEQILEAAARLFCERGFHGVSVDEIGKEVGITGGALYHHYSGKDEILATLLMDAMDKVAVETDKMFDDPQEELRFLVRHHARFAVANGSLLAIYAHEHRALVEPWKRLFVRRVREHAKRWERAVARCYPEMAEKDVLLAVQAAIGLLHSVVFWPPALLEREDLVDRLEAQVFFGLGALEPAAAC